jgi:hypothetical protein
MAWRAWVEGVRDNPTPGDVIWVTIRFEDTVIPRMFTKEYKYVSGTSAADFTAIILAERQNLRQLDAAKTVLENAIGNEVT